MKNEILIAAAMAISVSGCDKSQSLVNNKLPENSNNGIENKAGYFITMEGVESGNNKLSRNYWEESEDESLNFYWEDSDDEMITFAFDGENPLDFVDGKKYSDVKVSKKPDDRKNCKMQLMTGLGTEFKDGFVMWGLSPVKAGNVSEKAVISFRMPDSFVCNPDQPTKTSHIKDFILLSGTGIVNNNNAQINFDVLPAIFRFRITNKDTEVLKVDNVSLAGPFNEKASLKYNSALKLVDCSFSTEKPSHSISIKFTESISIAPYKSILVYGLVFPTKMSDEKISLRLSSNYGIMEATTSYSNIFKNDGFESNKYYTLGIPVSRKGIEFGDSSVSDFIEGDTCTINIDR